MRRSRLLTLESLGLVQETSDCGGYYRSMVGPDQSQLTSTGSPEEDERLRVYMLKRRRDSEESRARRINRLRKLARMDFKMVGGVSPIGFFGGGGGQEGQFRPSSNQPRM